jgi:chromosome segregation ATPase
MKNVYQSLRGVMQETLHRNKANSASGQISASEASSLNDPASLNDAMEELEKSVVDRIDKLKAAVTVSQAVMTREAEEAKQVIETLRAEIAMLEAKLSETEETARKKDVESQQIDESLNNKIAHLQSAVDNSQEALKNRDSEVNELESRVDALEKHVKDLESVLQQSKEETASEAQRAENITESSRAKIAALEAQLSEAEQTVREKEATIRTLEENLAAKVQELESEVSDKEGLLGDQIRQVTDPRSELEQLTDRMKEASSFAEQADAEQPTTSHSRNGGVTSDMDADQQIVPPEVFHRMIDGLSELNNIIRPIASLIVRNHAESLGQSMEAFPRARLSELLDALSGEISDEKVRFAFRERVGKL